MCEYRYFVPEIRTGIPSYIPSMVKVYQLKPMIYSPVVIGTGAFAFWDNEADDVYNLEKESEQQWMK